MKKLTEKQAWLTIAEDLARPRSKSKFGNRFGKRLRCICFAIEDIYKSGLISNIMACKMDIETRSYLEAGRAYFYPSDDPANDLLRALFCYMQYYMLGGK